METGIVGMNHYLEHWEMYKNREFVVLFNSGGWRTAYVDVMNTKLENMDEFECDDFINVHGGFTYKDNRLPFEHEESKKYAWLGWDYYHASDKIDAETAENYFGTSDYINNQQFIESMSYFRFRHMYTLSEVITECKHVIDLLEEV